VGPQPDLGIISSCRNALLLVAAAMLRPQSDPLSLAGMVSSHREYGACLLCSQAAYESAVWSSCWRHVIRQPSRFLTNILEFRDDFRASRCALFLCRSFGVDTGATRLATRGIRLAPFVFGYEVEGDGCRDACRLVLLWFNRSRENGPENVSSLDVAKCASSLIWAGQSTDYERIHTYSCILHEH